MTRKDFELIALTIRSHTDSEAERFNLGESFSATLSDANPAFDKDRFMAACLTPYGYAG